MVWHISSDRDLMPRPWRLSWRSSLEQLNQGMIAYGARHADVIIVQNAEQAALLRRYHGRSDAVHIPNFHPAPVAPIAKANDRIVVCLGGEHQAAPSSPSCSSGWHPISSIVPTSSS